MEKMNKYVRFNINCAEEDKTDAIYFSNTGKRRSSIYNLFLPEIMKTNTTLEDYGKDK